MKTLIDTNIILDVALTREPFGDDSRKVLTRCEFYGQKTTIAWHTFTSGHHLLRREPGSDPDAGAFFLQLFSWVKLAPTGMSVASGAMESSGGNLEDKLQAGCARAAGADVIATRNVKDFQGSPVRAITPREFLKEVGAL